METKSFAEMSVVELRTLLRETRSKVTTKIARNRRTHGTEIAKTKYDPRKAVGQEKKLNRRQLVAQIERQQSFVSRKTQFVPDVFGAPIERGKFRALEKANAQADAVLQANFNKVKDLFNPVSGMTIGDRMRLMMPARPSFANKRKNVMNKFEISSKELSGEKSLKTLMKNAKRYSTPAQDEKNLRKMRRAFNTMLREIKRSDIIELANGLTSEQFGTLWKYSTLPDALSFNYLKKQMENEGKEIHYDEDIFSQNLDEVVALIGWGKTLELGS